MRELLILYSKTITVNLQTQQQQQEGQREDRRVSNVMIQLAAPCNLLCCDRRSEGLTCSSELRCLKGQFPGEKGDGACQGDYIN